MTDSREPSYYEIALTNRQVVTVFVILLVCVVAAFFSGVWVGRGETTPVTATATVAETPAPPAEETDEPLGELNFFNDKPEPAVESTPPSKAPSEPPSAPPERSEPSPEPSSPPATQTTPTARPATVVPGSAIVVQVFSSNDRGQAERVVNRLRSAGFAALLSPVEVRSQTMYRVRIGPFQERDEAEQVAARVRRDFRLDTWITSG